MNFVILIRIIVVIIKHAEDINGIQSHKRGLAKDINSGELQDRRLLLLRLLCLHILWAGGRTTKVVVRLSSVDQHLPHYPVVVVVVRDKR